MLTSHNHTLKSQNVRLGSSQTVSMASVKGEVGNSLPQLDPNEKALADLASDNPVDELSLSEKEEQILKLYDLVYEQQLEEALLNQDPADVSSVEDVDEELAKAERELLEARATHSIQRKAAESVLMAEPSIQAVYSAASTPIDRTLLSLINRRDVLSLAYENLAHLHSQCQEKLSDAEVQNMDAAIENQALVRSLLSLTSGQKSEKEKITDPKMKEQLEELEGENKRKRADWVTMKRIVGAAIAASGVDWASDEKLLELVLDESTEDA